MSVYSHSLLHHHYDEASSQKEKNPSAIRHLARNQRKKHHESRNNRCRHKRHQHQSCIPRFTKSAEHRSHRRPGQSAGMGIIGSNHRNGHSFCRWIKLQCSSGSTTESWNGSNHNDSRGCQSCRLRHNLRRTGCDCSSGRSDSGCFDAGNSDAAGTIDGTAGQFVIITRELTNYHISPIGNGGRVFIFK